MSTQRAIGAVLILLRYGCILVSAIIISPMYIFYLRLAANLLTLLNTDASLLLPAFLYFSAPVFDTFPPPLSIGHALCMALIPLSLVALQLDF